MRILVSIFLVAASSQAFAFDSYTFIDECKSEAILNLESEAKAKQATLDGQTVAVDSIDDRWYSPSKYVWFSGRATKTDGTVVKLTTMLQKSASNSKKCSAFKKENAPKKVAFASECKDGAKLRLREELKNQGAELDEKTVAIDEVDDRWYSPSKYVWFVGAGKKANGDLVRATVMMQKNTLSLDKCGPRSKQGALPGQKPSETTNPHSGRR